MPYQVRIHSAPERHLAVVRRRLKWSELGGNLLQFLDRVYVQVRAGAIVQSGHNVFVYRDPTKEGVTAEVGVEVSGPFEAIDEVVYSSTPSGEVASTLHVGPYSELGGAYDALVRWCKEHNRPLAGTYWEVYGDWNDDPAKLETEVFYLLT
ncbi:MAG TPA: GyrI-like domain-containing protein [Pyrinomonadaceae bacterium]